MTPLLLVRHAPTAWNDEGRIQGRTDVPLNERGRAAARRWTVPAAFADYRWVCSPLQRARETARLMGLEPELEPTLAEMDYGRWEGRLLEELRAELGEEMAATERRGLDFQPPGGESPRAVQRRVRPWLERVGRGGLATAAVAHHAVIRAIYALASGWDMTDKPPTKMIKSGVAHLFRVDGDGVPHTEQLNIPLEPVEAAS